MLKKLLSSTLTVLLLLSLAACGGSPGNPDAVKSEPDSLHGRYLAAMAALEAEGDALAAKGLTLQGESYYAFAAASVSSLRYAVEYILFLRGEGESLAAVCEGSLVTGWDDIAAVCYASPYPYYFEGLIMQIQGEDEKADFFYAAALLNPAYPEEDVIFYYLRDLAITELHQMQTDLRAQEEHCYSRIALQTPVIERDVLCFDADYLLLGAGEAIEAEDYATAYGYASAAQRTDPFRADNYSAAALCALLCGDLEAAALYIDEGLILDPEHEGINAVFTMLLDGFEVPA